MPTSVLLAVLAAAGLLALAPALTRRYDATERVAEERATSTARVIARRRRRRTVPGRRPIKAPRFSGTVWNTARSLPGGPPGVAPGYVADPRSGAFEAPGVGRSPAGNRSKAGGRSVRSAQQPGRSSGGSRSAGRGAAPGRSTRRSAKPQRRRTRPPTALHRRRRVFLALLCLNLVELAGVLLVGPGFWIGFSVSFVVLLADLVYLRRRAVVATRQRRQRARRAAWIAAEQAAVRREHARRAADRATARLAERRRVAQSRENAADGYVERYRTTS